MSIDGEILPLPLPPPSTSLVKVRQQAHHGVVSDDDELPHMRRQKRVDDDPGAVVVRVKLVVSKQELKKMLLHNKEGVSLDDMVSLMQKQQEADDQLQEQDGCRGWRPALQSIPEGGVF
ncbi:hypothetical protein GUJ93_ZPchr0009g1391 [Zizania palustris]|uniref:Uncharacterized protein n=1 Tax=Zizania palustris TaxID=103762 RepID=A0A8J5RS46_ZIZPA|nr:hypothetical protein GUJ93_ZPchr0009g1391 [Zizania palustris]